MTQDATVDYRNPMHAVENDVEPTFQGLSVAAWLKIAIVSALMIATFRFNLLRLWLKTNPFSGEPNWRHAICVPLIGFYYLFVHRDELLETKAYTAWSGLGILIFGILLFAYGIYPGQNDFVKDFGMVVALFGVVALLCGWRVMKIAWFPIVFLICAIPWPELVYSYIASPLQRLAASVAVGVLRALNVTAFNAGTKIIINAKGNVWRTLNVAEACAGLRSLMTFISVAAAIAFLSARPLWQKIIVTFMAIPIAIFCNVMRVSGQGILDHYWSQELSEGFAHQFVGIVMLVPGFFMILFVGWLLDVVFIEVVDERELRKNRAPIKPATKPMEAIPAKMARLENLPKPAISASTAEVGITGTTTSILQPLAKTTSLPTTATARPTLTPAPKPPAALVSRPVAPPLKAVPASKLAVPTPSNQLPKTTSPAVAAVSVATPKPVALPPNGPAIAAKPVLKSPAVKPPSPAAAGAPVTAAIPVKRPAAIVPPTTGPKPQSPGTPSIKPSATSVAPVRLAATAKPAIAPVASATVSKPFVSAPTTPETPEVK